VGQTGSTRSGHCRLGMGAKRVQWDSGGDTTDWGVSLGGPNDRACAEERGCSIVGAVGSSFVGTDGSCLVGWCSIVGAVGSSLVGTGGS
jgi:hypothetical protein